jgi:quercetin dioxygenase-like cupin family protein
MRALLATVVIFLFGACAGAVAREAMAVGSTVAQVSDLTTAPRRRSPRKNATITLLAQGQNAFLGRLEMDPSAEVPPHRDSTEEYIHVLSGSGLLHIDGHAHTLGPGSTVFMPAQAEVRYQNGPEPLVALQVFAGPEPAAKYGAWSQIP